MNNQNSICKPLKRKNLILGEIGPGHMSQMPFTEAFIMEVQRLASVLPICPPRLVTSDITVCGRLLKKGVQVQMNLYALHRNEEHWGPDASDFRPERFWDQSGCVKQDEWLQPFGYGNFFPLSDYYCLRPSLTMKKFSAFLSSYYYTLRPNSIFWSIFLLQTEKSNVGAVCYNCSIDYKVAVGRRPSSLIPFFNATLLKKTWENYYYYQTQKATAICY